MDRSAVLLTDNSFIDLIDSVVAELRHHFQQLRLPRVQRYAAYFAHVHT